MLKQCQIESALTPLDINPLLERFRIILCLTGQDRMNMITSATVSLRHRGWVVLNLFVSIPLFNEQNITPPLCLQYYNVIVKNL